MSGLDDNVLRMFIDEVFDQYDYDRSGSLDVNQLHTFFNQLFIQLNDPRRFTQQQTQKLVSEIDLQRNGVISKPELFMLFKRLTSGGALGNNNQPYHQQYQPQQFQPQQYQPQQYQPQQYQPQQYQPQQYYQQAQPQFYQQGNPQYYQQGQQGQQIYFINPNQK